jgi:hypothetical protein
MMIDSFVFFDRGGGEGEVEGVVVMVLMYVSGRRPFHAAVTHCISHDDETDRATTTKDENGGTQRNKLKAENGGKRKEMSGNHEPHLQPLLLASRDSPLTTLNCSLSPIHKGLVRPSLALATSFILLKNVVE